MPLRQDPLPRTSGIPTFLMVSPCSIEDLTEGMVAVTGAPFDLSTTARIGARFGPRAYRETSAYYARHAEGREWSGAVHIDSKERVVPRLVRERLKDTGDIEVFPQEWDKTQASLREAIYQISRRGALPVILGGDHFVTYPLVQGFKDGILERDGERVGYIQFSSQLDLGDEDPVWGKVWRGGTTRRILDGKTVAAKNIVWVGVNGYVRSEQWELAQYLGLNVFTLDDVRQEGITEISRRAADIATADCDSVYLSVDLDVLDGGHVAATGSPSFDGMRNIDLLKAMDILSRRKIGALDLCGLNPVVEIENQGNTGQRFGVDLILRFIYPRIMDDN